MKRQHTVLLFAGFTLPFLLGLPALINLIFPGLSLIYLETSLLFSIYVIFYLVIGRDQILPVIKTEKPSPWWQTSLVIILIQGLLLCVFCSQLLTLGQYEFSPQINNPDLIIWFKQQVIALTTSRALFPWGGIILGLIIFHFAIKRTAGLHPLSKSLNFPPTRTGLLWQRVIDTYITQAGFFLIATAMAFTAIQISWLIYPEFSSLHNPLLGMMTGASILLIGSTKKAAHFFSSLKHKAFNLLIFSLLIILMITVFLIIFSLAGAWLIKKGSPMITLFHPLVLYPHSSIQLISKIWLFSWWINIIPLAASLILYVARGQRLKSTILISLVLPGILFGLMHYFKNDFLQIVISSNVLYIIQALALLGLLLFFNLRLSHDALWFGFIPNNLPRKSRKIEPRLLWIMPAALLIFFALTGIDGLTFFYFFASSFLVLLYWILLLKTNCLSTKSS